MTPTVSHGDVERLRALVLERLGPRVDDRHLGTLAELLRERVAASGAVSAADWLRRASAERGAGPELRALAARLTVGETYFFRNPAQFRALVDVVVPDRMAAQASARRLRFLSAGCATGEEPYSIAATLRDGPWDLRGWSVEIVGADVNPVALARARTGRYREWALRATPAAVRDRHFRRAGRDYQLDDAVRGMVTFRSGNLAYEQDDLLAGPGFDAVFCRNVIMYFAPAAQRAALARLMAAPLPGGYLFLGEAESAGGPTPLLELCDSHGTFYYRRAAASERSRAGPGATHPPPRVPATDSASAPAPPPPSATSLAPPPSPPSSASSPLVPEPESTSPAGGDDPFADVLALLREERFDEALAALDGRAAAVATGRNAALLRAATLALRGDLGRARRICRDLLERDESDAEAHYVAALCSENLGDPEEARAAYDRASRLAPRFALAWLHRGLFAKRSGDRRSARADLRRAQALLPAEDDRRIVLFGGGFGRAALLRLCEAQVADCGEAP